MELTIREQDIDLNDFIPKAFQTALLNSLEYIHLYHFDEDWRSDGVTRNDKYLRAKFWEVLSDCVSRGVKMTGTKMIYDGIISKDCFYRMLRNPVRAGYFFSKPLDHDLETRVLLDSATQKMVKILSLPLRNEKGRIDSTVLNAHIKLYTSLNDRVHGQAIQRVQQHTVNETKKLDQPRTVEELQEELKLLESGRLKDVN